jgi:hypothetical protein
MDRTGTKAAYDGMRGPEATSVETFGFIVAEDTDGITRFYRTAQPSYATYSDGEQRRWQAPGDEFEFPRLAIKVSSAP